jgi:hypothetical protein
MLQVYTDLILFTEEMLAPTLERMVHLPRPAQRAPTSASWRRA